MTIQSPHKSITPSGTTKSIERLQERAGVSAAQAEPFPLGRRGRRRLPFTRQLPLAQLFVGLLLITLAAAVLRLYVTRGLSLEEIRNIDQVRVSFGTLISHLIHRGVYAPLDPVLLWLAVHIFGDGDAAVRLPGEVAGILTVPALAWLGAELFDRRTALVAAALSAVSPILVWYSQEASPYALVALFGTLAVTGTVRAARRGGRADWTLHTIAGALVVWSDWSGVFILAATELVLLGAAIDRRTDRVALRRMLLRWGAASLALAYQLVPLVLLFASQLRTGGGLVGPFSVSASGVSFYTAVSNASWAIFGFQPSVITSALSAVWPLAMLACLLSIGRGVPRRGLVLVGCAVTPLLGLLALGVAVPGAFDVRFAAAATPLLVLLFSRLGLGWPHSNISRGLIVGAVFLLLGGALINQQLNHANPRRSDYGQALTFVHSRASARSVVLYEPSDFKLVLRRLAPKLSARPLTRTLPTRAADHEVFVVTSFQNDPSALSLRNREIGALRATRHLVLERSYPDVRVWLFR